MLVATIGNFDGVHRGHQAIVAAARAAAGPSGRVVAVTFEPLPVAVLRPDSVQERLTSSARREALLHAAGCDDVVALDPRQGILGASPEEFIASLRRQVPFKAIAEGGDFRFGRARSGDVSTLRQIGERAGFRTLKAVRPDVVPAALEALLPGFADAVRDEVEAALAGEGVVARFRERTGPIADALLAVTDARAARAANRTVASAYQALRSTARPHVAEAVPGVGRLLATILERFPA